MCTESCIAFGIANIREKDIRGKTVIEVGAQDVNGSLRPQIEKFFPARYIGVDIQKGPGVDEVCSAEGLLDKFGRDRFDFLICTELLEHARDWRAVIHNIKNILRPGGTLVITTRSAGFHFHRAPFDFWRYETADMKNIFSDFTIQALEADPSSPGVFMRARKPDRFVEKDLSGVALYSIITGRRMTGVRERHIKLFKMKLLVLSGVASLREGLIEILPKPIHRLIKGALQRMAGGRPYDFWEIR